MWCALRGRPAQMNVRASPINVLQINQSITCCARARAFCSRAHAFGSHTHTHYTLSHTRAAMRFVPISLPPNSISEKPQQTQRRNKHTCVCVCLVCVASRVRVHPAHAEHMFDSIYSIMCVCMQRSNSRAVRARESRVIGFRVRGIQRVRVFRWRHHTESSRVASLRVRRTIDDMRGAQPHCRCARRRRRCCCFCCCCDRAGRPASVLCARVRVHPELNKHEFYELFN